MSRVAATLGRANAAAGIFAGWRGLGNFWVLVLVVVGGLGGLAQLLGPPRPHAPNVRASNEAASPRQEAAVQPALPQAQSPADPRSGRDQPGPIADPDPALLEPVSEGSSDMLPRIAADGRMPMQVYAAGFDRSSRRPRVAILMAGIGLSEADSLRAVRTLPGGVSFAASPYGGVLPRILAAARTAQHEYLLSVPMEPQGYPLNDSGNEGLMTSLGRAENMTRLLWAMSRFGGYVGATGALGDLRGERFAGLSDQFEPVLRQVGKRGLLYVDPRPGQAPPAQVWGRVVDLVVDDPATPDGIDARLAELEAIAKERGSALGLAGAPRPVTVDRIAAWTDSLADKGLALAPVSAIVQTPAREGSGKNLTRDAARAPSTPKAAAE